MDMQRATPVRQEEQTLRQMKEVLQRVRSHLEDAFAPSGPSGMTTAQLHMLHQVQLAGEQGRELSSAGVARLCAVTPQTMQASLVRAEKAGWVKRGTHPQNERLVLWHITREGHTTLKSANQAFQALLSRVWRGVSVKQMTAMQRVLEDILRNLQQEDGFDSLEK